MDATEQKTKRLTMIGMLCAIAFAVMVVGRIPIVLFLKYDPKDVVITIGGFIFGPLAAFTVSAIVSVIEMVTVSDTGFIGCVMNILSSCSFACTAAVIYKRKHTLKGAVTGLLAGVALMTFVMLLWNYLVTPIYLGYPREAVAELLIPAFLPFNLLKGGINTALILLLYKHIVNSLRKAKLIEDSKGAVPVKSNNTGIMLVALVLLATGVLLALVLKGVI
ncbi:ECF transporter S component [Lachnospiraceae bacterium NSJ-143]|nr:ECF transporter S component [Lachnospiraceae bacterium NSJ-143]